MGLGRTPAPRREYRRTLSLPPSFLPAYLQMPRSPLLQKARWEPPSLLTPHSALELLGFFKNHFSYLETGVAPALAELAASSGSVPRHSGAGRLLPIQPGFPHCREAEGRRRVPGWAPEQGDTFGRCSGGDSAGETPSSCPTGTGPAQRRRRVGAAGGTSPAETCTLVVLCYFFLPWVGCVPEE